MTIAEPIPLTVIGGYLGAGKTTLLNRLLLAAGGRRLAVVVNDFGSINIDASLIAAHDGETLSLTNGCICCTLANGFQTTLSTLRTRANPPEHVVVEASGVADPLAIGQYGHLPGFSLDGVVVLADAETIRTRSRDRYVGKTIIRQLQGADMLVLTKLDLVSDADRIAVRTWLRAVSPNATLLDADEGTMSPEVMLGVGAHATAALPVEPLDVAADHGLSYGTWTFDHDAPLTVDAIDAFAAAIPEGIVRAKGLVHLADDPDHAAVFQLVGRRWSLTEGPDWGPRPPRTTIVLIGPQERVDWAALQQQLGNAVSGRMVLDGHLPSLGSSR